jgi:hypothetical protein
MLATFLCHADSVQTLIPLSAMCDPPSRVLSAVGSKSGFTEVLQNMRMRSCLISIGRDNTVCLIDPEELYWYSNI